MTARETVVSADDVVMLSALVEHAERRKEPDRSARPQVSDSIRPPAAAALNTRVEFEDLGTGRRESVRLVHPSAADATAGLISVLSPVGRALLGKRAGHAVEVTLPSGDARDLMVITVHEEGGR